jgi:hypothetical protein
MKRTLMAFAAFAVAVFAAAGEAAPLASPATLFPSSVGVFASTMIGGGLSYQRWHGPLGWSATIGGMIQPATYASGESLSAPDPDYYVWRYNAELDLMYKLYASTFADWLAGDLFVYGLLAHRGGVESMDSAPVDASKPATFAAGDFGLTYSLGLGIGYEITLFKHFSVPLRFGYTAEWPLRLNFDFGGGLRYRY